MGDDEVLRVIAALGQVMPKTLVFTGGEPTLYIDTVNRIAEGHPRPRSCAVQITTNGWFARDDRTLEAVLSRVRKLDRVLLSTDRFHGAEPSTAGVRRLADWCGRRGVAFGVSVCIASPDELVGVQALRAETGAEVTFTRAEACGRAKEAGISFPYPTFEARVLGRSCPNKGTLTYIAGRGFSVCCANLAFNAHGPGFVHPTLEEHLASGFYREIESRTLGEMLAARAGRPSGLLPSHSSACALCEHIHTDAGLNRFSSGDGRTS